jgi:hypothetical protein
MNPRPSWIRLHALAPVTAACLALWAPATARAGGALTTEPRTVTGFTRVRVEAPVDVTVVAGKPFACTVRLDAALMPRLTTRVDDGTLVIATDGHRFRPSRGARITVHLPTLRGVTTDGSADATVTGADAGGPMDLTTRGSGDLTFRGAPSTLTVTSDGSGNLTLEGAADHLVARLSGSGDLHAAALLANDADVTIDGSGDAEVRLDGGEGRFRVHGSGDLTWTGKGTVKTASVEGSGSITRKETP